MTVVMLPTAGIDHADEPEEPASETAQFLESVPEVETGVQLLPSTAGFVADGSTVVLPEDSTRGIAIATPDGDAVNVNLPGDATGVMVGDAVVYDEVATDTSVVAEATQDGETQVIVTLESSSAPADVSFPVDAPDGASLEPNPDGSVSLVISEERDGESVVVTELGTFEAPWAVDSDGDPPQTSYAIDGLTLTQTIEFDAATQFPVVADPKFTTGWTGLFVRWSRSEALWLTGLGLTATAAALGTLCAGPHAALCAAAVGSIYYATKSLSDYAIKKAYKRGCRLETRLAPYIRT